MDIRTFLERFGDQRDDKRCSMAEVYARSFREWISQCAGDAPPKEPRVVSLRELSLNSQDGFFIWSYTGSSSSWLNDRIPAGRTAPRACRWHGLQNAPGACRFAF